MTLLNTAKAIYSGAATTKAVYLGDKKIWPIAPPDDGFTPFVNPTFTLGGRDHPTITRGMQDKGYGASVSNSSFQRGYANLTIDGLRLDYKKPWGLKYWIYLASGVTYGAQYFMNISNGACGNSHGSQSFMGVFFEQMQGKPGQFGFQNTVGQPLGDTVSAEIDRWGALTRDKWWLITIDVGLVNANPLYWQNVTITADDQAGTVKTTVRPWAPDRQFPFDDYENHLVGMQFGLTNGFNNAIRWVPVGWKGTVVPA